MSLYAELKRRNVFRVAVAYLAGAWLLTEVAGTLFPAFGVPDWGIRFVVIILALGFLPALIFSWVYELTPDGLKREKDVIRDASITHMTAKRLDGITIGIIAVALVFILIDRFWMAPRYADLAGSAVDAPAAPVQAPVSELAGPAYPPDAIAVLPFVNMSDDEANEYFSDGISEELLNLLAKIPELKVIARTSSFAFKGKDMTISEVAGELNVGHVLEGSVRKAGDQVRITAQLIRASDSSHLWSETYDRKLDNIFAIQDEIAAAVVQQLKITLLGDAPKTKAVDPEAYALFLQARHLNNLGSSTSNQKAAELLQQALEIAPDFSAAWSELGRNWQNKVSPSQGTGEEAYLKSKEAQNKALELDPENAVAYSRLGFDSLYFDGDLPASANYFQKALALEPGNAIVLANAASLAMTLGRVNQAVLLRELAHQLDPLNALVAFGLGWSYLVNEQLDESEAILRKSLLLSPERPVTRGAVARVLIRKGDLSNPEEIEDLIAKEPYEPVRLTATVGYRYRQGHMAESDAALEALVDKYHDRTGGLIALAYAIREDVDKAIEWLRRTIENEGPQAFVTIRFAPEFKILHDDPRWQELLTSTGLSGQQLADIEFEFELPD